MERRDPSWFIQCKGEDYLKARSLIKQYKRPLVTIFGGGYMVKEDFWWQRAFELGYLLRNAGFGILTGGGSGIMEAALCGAFQDGISDDDLVTFGIGVVGVDEDFRSPCAQNMIHVSSFADRKYLLVNYSVGFVIFPGGLGTFDELSDLLNLIKHGLIHRVPIVLMGTEFWQFYLALYAQSAAQGWIKEKYTDLLFVTDSPQEALDFTRSARKR